MKSLSKIAIGAAMALLLAAMVPPTAAECGGARLVDNRGAYLVSNPNWGGAGADRTCQYGYGCYLAESGGGPISATVAGVFWGFDTTTGQSSSDPAVNAGIDNGGWDISNWTKSRTAGDYYYAGFLTLDTGSTAPGEQGGAGLPINWSFPVDGCPDSIDPDSCTCIMVTDQWDGVGYFMTQSAITDAGGDFIYAPDTVDSSGAATMRLLQTPKPEILMSERVPADGSLNIQVGVADIATSAADYRDPGCDCNIGYLIYQQLVGTGGLAPTDRNLATGGWTLSTLPADPATQYEFGDPPPTINVACTAGQSEEVYLAIALVEEGGLVGLNVSENSFRVECDSTLAEPSRPDRGDERGRSADAPRGRGNNRGQRNK